MANKADKTVDADMVATLDALNERMSALEAENTALKEAAENDPTVHGKGDLMALVIIDPADRADQQQYEVTHNVYADDFKTLFALCKQVQIEAIDRGVEAQRPIHAMKRYLTKNTMQAWREQCQKKSD